MFNDFVFPPIEFYYGYTIYDPSVPISITSNSYSLSRVLSSS